MLKKENKKENYVVSYADKIPPSGGIEILSTFEILSKIRRAPKNKKVVAFEFSDRKEAKKAYHRLHNYIRDNQLTNVLSKIRLRDNKMYVEK